jgi:hypothetical protein
VIVLVRPVVEKGPGSTARLIPTESYKEHVRGNVIMRAKARVAGDHGSGKGENRRGGSVLQPCMIYSLTGWRVAAVEDKLTSGRENRLKSRGLSSALGRARNQAKSGACCPGEHMRHK